MPNALSMVNKRKIMLKLARKAEDIASDFIGEIINSTVMKSFINTLTPIFSDAVARQEIFDFKIICDKRNNTPSSMKRKAFRFNYLVKFSPYDEWIGQDFEITQVCEN